MPWAAVRPPGGVPALRAAVAAHCYTSLGPDDVLLCSGASEALVASVLALGHSGRAVIALSGTYPSFTGTLRALGARRYRSFDRCPAPVCALATNPAVPSGQRIDVAEFINRSLSAGSIPIVDEVHRHIVLDNAAAPQAAADVNPAAVSIGDLSKPLGLGGLRVGWVATRNRRVRERIERALQLITGGPSVLADLAALAAFEAFDQHVDGQRQRAQANAPAVYAELRRAGWSFIPPQLGLTFTARPRESLDRPALLRALDAGFFLVPCSVLDVTQSDSALRISVLAEPAALRAALELVVPSRHKLNREPLAASVTADRRALDIIAPLARDGPQAGAAASA